MINKIKNAWICSIKGNSINPVFGDLIFHNGIITKIIKRNFKEFINNKSEKENNSYDAKGKVITIPNINFHEHIYSRLSKGLPIKGSTDDFINVLKNLWWKLDFSIDHEMTKASAELTSIEAIKNGVTYIFDHHASPNKTIGSLETISKVIKKNNLNAVLAFESSDRNSKKLSEESLLENSSHIIDEDNQIKYMFGLHASFTINDETLKNVSEIVNKHNMGIHIHLCEDNADRIISKNKFGTLPLARLLKYNLINDKSILSHSIHLSKTEYQKIFSYGSAIAFNPDSNMNNAVGINNFNLIPIEQTILCGTDGMHSNIAKTLKSLFLLLRHSGLTFEQTFSRFVNNYFHQINFVKKYFPDFPGLNLNEKANFIIWDYVPPTPFNKDNFWGHYIYGMLESHISSTVQDGKFLMKDKILLDISELEINKEIYKQGLRLFNKFKKL